MTNRTDLYSAEHFTRCSAFILIPLLFQFLRQVTFFIICFVSLAVLQIFHQFRRRIADFEGDREVAEFFDIIKRLEDRIIGAAVFFGRRLNRIAHSMGRRQRNIIAIRTGKRRGRFPVESGQGSSATENATFSRTISSQQNRSSFHSMTPAG